MTSGEQTWRATRTRAIAARGVLVALGLATGILLACWARSALAAPARFQGSLDSMVRYLQDDQNPDGGFGGEPGEGSNNDFSAWVALALGAAGINPRDQTPAGQHHVGGHSLYGYLTEQASTLSLTTDFERELLVVDATGTAPTDFGGVNLVERILQRQLTEGPHAGAFVHEAGSSEPGMNDTIFAILALSPIHEQAAEAAVQAAAKWVESEQDCDGGWPPTAYRTGGTCLAGGDSLPKEAGSEVDMTGAAIEALNAAGRKGPAREVEEKAFEYLKTAQDADGGFPEEPGESEPNVASTAWAVQAMWSAGIDPEAWVTGNRNLETDEPLSYMASLQQEDGHIRWEETEERDGVFMTAYAGTAMAGDAYPVPPPPYEPLPPAPSEISSGGAALATSTGPGRGDGGESLRHGRGASTGGGGLGAVLFSRPQPNSKGHTSGGVRQLTDEHGRATGHRRNPGPSRRTTILTIAGASVHRDHDRQHRDHRRINRPVKARDLSNRNGPGGVAPSGGAVGAGAGSRRPGSGQEVRGVPIGAPAGVLNRGAPGLHSAGAGGNQTPSLTIAIAALIALLLLAGSLIERRRPQMTL